MIKEDQAVFQARRKASRALDWFCAAMVLAWGISLALPGETLASSPAYEFFVERGISETAWASILISVGALRLLALVVNGHAPQGSPIVRGLAAFLGVIIWAHFLAGFLDVSIRMGVASAGIGINLVMLGADIFSTGRASADAIRARQRHVFGS